ncbi:hypothetical protein [Caballeronia sordidicola]|uniref:DUF2029 domain-containing protein n=1 Tax=Caballeronia sordidicola TaxID=196367 RepID=A0A226WZP8_CABSO|nr:hypothetical protein [Caballeronia sordidicola]OXC76088.1 hypothetical protein BSU04_23625 [Caballeronia sordidicola]
MKKTAREVHSLIVQRLRGINLNSSSALTRACFVVPVLFGLYSLWLGADSNWDLYNYHLYNPFAWLHGKLDIDLAPAGMQSYFNPLLDVFLYLLNTHLPSRVVGFLMGALHGMTYVLLAGIARHVLPSLSDNDRYRVPILVALAGCLTANFLSGLGNSMGDDTTMLFVLGGLLFVLSKWAILGLRSRSAVLVASGSGLLVGLGTGLKLTNAIYAVALCVALLSYPGGLIVRLRLGFLFGIGVLSGTAATGGYWMFHMWQLYGNPLYPQFGAIFYNPLTQAASVSDTRWLPRGFLESAFWPFIFAVDSHRVGETAIRQIIWPIVYAAFWCWLLVVAASRLAKKKRRPMDSRQRLVILFVAIGYVLWMKMFSIYRYLVAIEVLTPLVLMLLLYRFLPGLVARNLSVGLIGLATAVVIMGGAKTWGHEGWSDPLYHADVPILKQPERTTAIIEGNTTAWGWLATQFPANVAFTQLDSSFPATAAFGDRIRSIVKERGGPAFGVVNGAYNWRIDNVASMNTVVARMGLMTSERGCNAVRWIVTHLRLHAAVISRPEASSQCSLGLRSDDEKDLQAENLALALQAAPIFKRYGFVLDAASCTSHRAGIGKGVLVYQWCPLTRR